MLAYADTSALVKLVVAEAASTALRHAVHDADLVASALVRTELHRAAGRHTDRMASRRVDELLEAIALVAVDAPVLELAGHLTPTSLRSLDALHLATALGLGDRLDQLFTYDIRMAAAARVHGIEVAAPGSS